MSSACEVTSVSGYDSAENRKRCRKELNCNEYYGYTVEQFVTDTETGRVCRIKRFSDVGGVPHADVRYWRDNPSSANRKLLKQVELLSRLEPCDDPRKQEEENEDNE